jgi:hypothetical protein
MKNQLFTQLNRSSFSKLYEWRSPERVWVPKARSWYVSYSLFFVILIAILALLSEYILILAIIAFVFLWYVQAAIPPHEVEHIITSMGVRTFDQLFKWENIKYFWVSEKKGVKLLHLDYFTDDNPDFTKRLSLLLNHEEQDKEVFEIIIKFISYGNKDQVSFNPILQFLQGEYIDMKRYLPESTDAEILMSLQTDSTKSITSEERIDDAEVA